MYFKQPYFFLSVKHILTNFFSDKLSYIIFLAESITFMKMNKNTRKYDCYLRLWECRFKGYSDPRYPRKWSHLKIIGLYNLRYFSIARQFTFSFYILYIFDIAYFQEPEWKLIIFYMDNLGTYEINIFYFCC